MKISDIKAILSKAERVDFILADGTKVPEHFHVTEIGVVSKHFIDCGGTIRTEQKANFQLWDANDYEHRLKPQKLLNIIRLSEQKLDMNDLEIEIEYQAGTIGKYGLDHNGEYFILTDKHTTCLAKENCEKPSETETKSCCGSTAACC